MNIFLTSLCPVECARDLDTRRLSKMILETCQLLSTAKYYRLNDWDFFNDNPAYKPTHKNHPCAIWVRESVNNYCWLMELLHSYAKEYYNRKGKEHKSYIDQVRSDNLKVKNYNVLWKDLVDNLPNCAKSKDKGLDYTHLPIVQAYREYLKYQWFNMDKYKPTWLGDYMPSWINN